MSMNLMLLIYFKVRLWIVSNVQKSTALINLTLIPIKHILYSYRSMSDFWTIFNHEWTDNIQKRVGTSTTSSSNTMPTVKTSEQQSTHKKQNKQSGADNGDEDEQSCEEEKKGVSVSAMQKSPQGPRKTRRPCYGVTSMRGCSFGATYRGNYAKDREATQEQEENAQGSD